jgi:hypothetical protein
MPRVVFALLLLLLLSWLHQASRAQSPVNGENQRTATVSGQVILNGEPLSGVTIRIFPDRMLASGDPRKPLQAITDGQGKYRITGIIAGNYNVGIFPNEFMIIGPPPSSLQQRMLGVSEGEIVEKFDLILKRDGIITGRITDSSDRPLARQLIELTRVGDDGKPQPRPFNHPAVKITDEQGNYHITNLPAGRYLVSSGMTESARFGSPSKSDVYYPQTFYPGVRDPAEALVVVVTEGAEANGIDIRMVDSIKTYYIKGRVIRAETGEPAEGIEIFYYPYREERGGITGGRSNPVRSNSEGEFLFQGLLPGKYALSTQIGGDREYFIESVICEISENGIDGIEVKLQQGSSISGIVAIDGANDPSIQAKLSQLRIGGFSKEKQPVILPREPAGINADGSFRIAGLRPGKIYFSLLNNSKAGSFSIKRIEHNNALIPDGLEIGAGEHLSDVRVIVGYGSLTLHGEVKVIGGSLPPHIGIYLNLNRLSESESGNTLGAFVDARGQFIFQNLAPGDYEIRAIGINSQPGEPVDKSLTKLIYNIKQKISISSNSQPTTTLVIDLSRKEGNQ